MTSKNKKITGVAGGILLILGSLFVPDPQGVDIPILGAATSRGDFQITSQFLGYVNKADITNIPPGYLVSGSQNVISTDGNTVALRGGYTVDGTTFTDESPVLSSYDWLRHTGDEGHVRFGSSTIQYRFVTSTGTVQWVFLDNGYSSSSEMNFAEFWDTTELIDEVLFVNGTSTVSEWSGAVTSVSSTAATTITKNGTSTWAQDGFYTAKTGRALVIGGAEYTYTGGENTQILTGVSPSAASLTTGIPIAQAVTSTLNSAITTLPDDFENEIIGVLDNQIYVGARNDRRVFISKQNNYKDFSNTATRLPGEGATITLDDIVRGFIPQEEAMYVSAGEDQWYQITFKLSADNTAEAFVIDRLKTTAQQGAQEQALIEKIKNSVVYISREPTLDELGRVENVETPQSRPLSDAIKNDFDITDFSSGDIQYFKNNIYIAVPKSSAVLIYNLAKGYWEAPQVLPCRRLAVISQELYCHSNAVLETYKLFDGTNDNGNSIKAVAAFSYQNFGIREKLKSFDEFYSEGYITSNSELTLTLRFDWLGTTQELSEIIQGDDTDIVIEPVGSESLAVNPLGTKSLGGEEEGVGLPKFRIISTFPRENFFEYQPIYSSDEVDYTWEVIGFGPQVSISDQKATFITK